MKFKIGVVDYGIGNLSSIKNTLSKLGFRAILSSDHHELKKSDLILLPGVGAFKPAMLAIKEKGLNHLIYEMVNENVPIKPTGELDFDEIVGKVFEARPTTRKSRPLKVRRIEL